jgi:NAD-dependent dihydropyrimidine dehydrogenase PreA subunit
VKGLGDPERVGKTEVDFDEATGVLDSAVCTDCHEVHATKAKDDPDSMTHEDKVPALCGSEDCHASDEVAERVGQVNALKTYEETHHGKAQKFGVEGVPNCIHCHVATSGSHKILSQTDPESDVHPDNVAKICADEDCHNVEFNVGSGSLHGKDEGNAIGKLISLFYTIVILGAAGFFTLYVVLDFTMALGKKGGK